MPYRFVVIAAFSLSALFAQGIAVGFGSAGDVARPTQTRPADPAFAGQPQAPQQPQQQQAPGGIEGMVTNATTGEPLKRVTLILMSMQPGPNASAPFSTVSDANGQFAMSNIPPGSYRLMAERTGYVRTDYGSRGPSRPGPALTLSAGQTLKELALRMQPHAVIAGRVFDEDGEPLSNVQVQAMSQRYVQGRRQLMPTSMGSTNDLGEYRVFGLPPGKYYVNAIYRSAGMASATMSRTANPNSVVEDEGYAPTFYPGTNDATSAVALQLQPGQPVTNIDFKLRRVRTVRVKGKVIGPLQEGRSMVMLMQQNDAMGMGARNMSTTQGPGGTFEIRGVTPGAYNLVAQQADQTGQYVARLPLNVGNANVENVEIVVRAGVAVTGQIRAEADSPINLSQVVVNLQPTEFGPFGGPSTAMVNADGTFTFPKVPPNTYRINTALRGLQSLYVKSVHAGEQELPDRELTIADGAPPALTLVLSAATAEVTGQVLADKPPANQGVMVVLVPPADKRDRADLYRVATSDQYGKFTLKSIPPGEYTMYAWDEAEPGSWQDPDFLARFENKGKRITLKEKDSVTVEAALLKVEGGQ